MKLLIGANQKDAEAVWKYQSQLWDCVKIGHGAPLYAYHFDDVDISLLAKKEVRKAVRLLRWYNEVVLCRFSEPPQDLINLLSLSPEPASEEEVQNQPDERT